MKKQLLTLAFAFVSVGAVMAQTTTPIWVPQTFGAAAVPANYEVYQVRAVNAATVWALVIESVANNSTVRRYARSVDGGSTWTGGAINIPVGLSVADLHPLDANTAWLAAYPGSSTASGAGIYKTTDGGVTWTRQLSASYSGAAAFPNIVYFWDANNGMTMGDPNPNATPNTPGARFEVYTTTDGGTNWVRNQNAPVTVNPAEYGLTGVRSVVGNTIWAGGYNDNSAGTRLYKSTDRGLTWTAAPTDIPKGIDYVAFSDASNGLMTDGLDIVRTTNGGTTNRQLATYTGPFRSGGIDNVPGLTNTYVSVGSSDVVGDSLVHYGSSISRDGGQTWRTLERSKLQFKVDMLSATIGWTGGYTGPATGTSTGGMFKLNSTLAPATATKAGADVQQAVQAFPNPSKDGVFTVRVALSKAAPREVVVTDALGREVYQKTLLTTNATAQDILVDLSKQAAGLYTLRLETAQGSVVKKLVIQ